MDGNIFYRNVFLLTQAVPPSKEFLKHFKEGMFEKPNTIGFQHVTHYLLTIYDADRFKKNVQWPLVCKKSEAKYRSDVKDFLTLIAHENPDMDFPQILASHLLHASGSKFNHIMANLSTVVLRTWIKNENEATLCLPKSKVAQDLSRTMLNNLVSQNTEIIDANNRTMSKNDEEAKEFANELEESIKKYSDELLQLRQNLIKLSSVASVHPDVKGRLADLDDGEVVQLWKQSVDESIELLKRKQLRLQTISELSTNVANMIGSIVSQDTNILDGKLLSDIDVSQLSEIDHLSPETQVMLYRVHESETLELTNFLSLFNLMLTDVRGFIEKYGFPDFSECGCQVSASCEDLKSMSELFHTMHDRVIELTKISKTNSTQESNFPLNYLHQYSIDNDLLDSILLNRSLTINIDWNSEYNGNEYPERFQLTPLEHIHRKLLPRYRRNDDGKFQALKLRPTQLISRINFNETRCTVISDNASRSSPLPRNSSSKIVDRWNPHKEGTYSRLFSTIKRRPATSKLNYSVRSGASSSQLNSIMDMNMSCSVYNASELRSRLHNDTDIDSPKKFTPSKNDGNDRASSTIIECEKFTRTCEFLGLTEEDDAVNNKMECTPISQKNPESPKKTEKPQKSRLSISDLVERFRKICDKSVNVPIPIEFSSDED
ncbi:uncharacterized protein dgt6 [Venturia canescens]|uniref:uncharacterized protein dgt6 n=1 Tax=Venturia canescens TaxID=32260 RepID=UPI001C9BE2BC|nr:uncharacterized protein LOC122416183 [Venturia canescens]